MGIDDLVNKGKQFLETNKEKIDDVLHSDQAEQVSDGVLQAGANSVSNLVPEGHQSKVDDVRATIDKRIGNE